MTRVLQGIALLNVKVVIVDIVQEHVHTAEIVGLKVDFLTKEAINDILCAKYLLEFQKQRTTATGWVIDFVDRCTTACSNLGKPVTKLGRCVELTSFGS